MKRLLCFALLLPAAVAAAEWAARPLAEMAIYPEFRASARVEALNESRIAAEVSGRIVALPLRIGARVAKGGELARIDPAEYRIAVDRAAAQLGLVESRVELAEVQLEQSRTLAGRGFVSDDALRVRETELAVLKNERRAAGQALTSARLMLERTLIRAPFDGVVGERLASVGDLATPGLPLLVLASTDETEIHARIPSAQIEGLQAAEAWTLHLDGAAYALRPERVLSIVDTAGQTRTVVFSGPPDLVPGLAGEVRWRAARPHLPPEFVIQRAGQLGAWIERAGEPVFVELPGAAVGRPVPVDWPPDTRVIDAGRFGIELPRAPVQGDAR